MAEKPPKPTGFKGKTTKVCGNCGLENPNRTRTCKGCLTEYVSKAVMRKEKIANMGQTNASHQRQLMEHRANILHDHHGQHVVIMAFSKHGRGYSTYFYGTPGPAEKFVNGKGPEPGKVAATLFDRFMRSELCKKPDGQATAITTQNFHGQTTSSQTTMPLNETTSELRPTTLITQSVTILPQTAPTIQFRKPTSSLPTTTATALSRQTTSTTQPTVSRKRTTTALLQPPTARTRTTTAVAQPLTITNPGPITTTSSSNMELAEKRSKPSQPTSNAGSSQISIKTGSKLWVLDKNKKPQAISTLFSLEKMHNKILPEGHVGILIEEILPGCRVPPACPTPFDGDVIEKGAYYIWPLQLLGFHSD